jgi:hypothetical protein
LAAPQKNAGEPGCGGWGPLEQDVAKASRPTIDNAIATALQRREFKLLRLVNDILSYLLQLPFPGKQTACLPCHARQRIRVRRRSPVFSGLGRFGRRQVPAVKFVSECLLRNIEEGTLVGCNLHQLRVG